MKWIKILISNSGPHGYCYSIYIRGGPCIAAGFGYKTYQDAAKVARDLKRKTCKEGKTKFLGYYIALERKLY